MRGLWGMRGMRRLEAIYGLVAAIYGCAVTVVIGAAVSSGMLPADKPGALFFQAVDFTAFLAVGLGAALHAADVPAGSAGPVGVALLWLGTAVAGMLTALVALSIGIFLLPGTALALAASVTALLRIPAQPRPPSPLGWLELLSGVAAPVAGLAGLGLLLYWPSIEYLGPDKGGTFSRADLYGIAPTLPLFLGALLLGVLVAIGAARRGAACPQARGARSCAAVARNALAGGCHGAGVRRGRHGPLPLHRRAESGAGADAATNWRGAVVIAGMLAARWGASRVIGRAGAAALPGAGAAASGRPREQEVSSV
jgi:hypothetical protein